MAAGGDVSQIVLQTPNAAAQLVLVLCSGVASSSSREESEEMYSGVSSVPRISSGSRSRLEETRRGNRKIANRSKMQIKRELTLEWCTSLVECCPP
jgi:hypothetical protein